MSQAATNGTMPSDWGAFYSSLQKQGNIPDASCASVDQNNALYSAMFLDLAVIQTQIAASGNTPFMTTIYADVLSIPDNLTWNLQNSGLLIIARRIEAGNNAQIYLDYRTSSSASLVLFADEFAGAVQAIAVTQNSTTAPTIFQLNANTVATGIQVDDNTGTPALTTLNRAQGVPPQLPDQFALYLSNSFIYASLLYDQNPTLALAQFTWTKEWAAQLSELLGLFLRSTSLLALLSAQVNAKTNGAAFVPYLTKDVYTDLAAAFVDEAKQYESDYLQLSTQQVVTTQFTQLAQNLLANAQYNSQYVNGLKAQSLSNYNNAISAFGVAMKNFTDQQTAVKMVAIDFQDIGLPEYEREQIVKAVFSIVQALVTFGGAIAAMLVGDEAAAPAAAEGAIEGVEAVEEAVGVGTAIAKLAKELSEVMGTLKKIVEGLKQVYELANSVMEAAANISDAQSMVEQMNALDTNTDGADLSDTTQWDIYKLKADAALAEPVEKGIGYAAAYQQALDILVIYGKSLAGAHLAVIQASQDYARILLQQQLAQQQQDQLQQYVQALQAGDKPLVAMMQQFYQRYLDAKSSLFAALKGYEASYFYWALQPSSVQAAIIDKVSDLDTGLQNMTQMAIDQQSALTHFSPPPSAMTQKLFAITDPALLATFQKTGKATWILPLDDPDFAQLDRIRLDTIRVWLEGATSEATLSINIKNSGNYLDRFDGSNFQFSSKPLGFLFQYHLGSVNTYPDWTFDNGQTATIELDGRVDNQVKYAYFQPTPFSEWTVSVDPAQVDVSALTKITMEFAGSAIGEVAAKNK